MNIPFKHLNTKIIINWLDRKFNHDILNKNGDSLAALITVLLFFLRFLFMTFMIFLINSICKKMPYGFIGGLAVCLIDRVVYIDFIIIKPLRIFPADYSYIESSLRLTPNAALNVALCVLYWGVLIAAACLVYRLMHKGSMLEKEEGSVQI